MLALPVSLLPSTGPEELKPDELAALLPSSVGFSVFIIVRHLSPNSCIRLVRDMKTPLTFAPRFSPLACERPTNLAKITGRRDPIVLLRIRLENIGEGEDDVHSVGPSYD